MLARREPRDGCATREGHWPQTYARVLEMSHCRIELALNERTRTVRPADGNAPDG